MAISSQKSELQKRYEQELHQEEARYDRIIREAESHNNSVMAFEACLEKINARERIIDTMKRLGLATPRDYREPSYISKERNT
jgi:hypothetical protein